jgi:short-chain Z-isoprenyl diphosphate synthase
MVENTWPPKHAFVTVCYFRIKNSSQEHYGMNLALFRQWLDLSHKDHYRGIRSGRAFKRLLGLTVRPIYRAYEVRLSSQIHLSPVPQHIGIILDGNRRYAERHGLTDPCEIYSVGASRLDDVLDWCGELAVAAVTLWVFSTDNRNRPLKQVSGILAAVEAKIRSLADHPDIHRRHVRVRAIGKLDLLPNSLRNAIRAAAEATAAHTGMVLTIAVAYGGHDEIVDAVRSLLAEQSARGLKLAETIPQITREGIARHLYTAGSPDPDLIIRTSGELRLSGFLLWQSAYSEFYFCDVPWPAFRKIDFLRAVRAYQQRKRRFGR